jgi:hypothetical protein
MHSDVRNDQQSTNALKNYLLYHKYPHRMRTRAIEAIPHNIQVKNKNLLPLPIIPVNL